MQDHIGVLKMRHIETVIRIEKEFLVARRKAARNRLGRTVEAELCAEEPLNILRIGTQVESDDARSRAAVLTTAGFDHRVVQKWSANPSASTEVVLAADPFT
jgi:hypothetical protein